MVFEMSPGEGGGRAMGMRGFEEFCLVFVRREDKVRINRSNTKRAIWRVPIKRD